MRCTAQEGVLPTPIRTSIGITPTAGIFMKAANDEDQTPLTHQHTQAAQCLESVLKHKPRSFVGRQLSDDRNARQPQQLKFLASPAHSPHKPMITVYHNPRCSKSRGACELISDVYNPSNEPVEVVEYLRTPLSVAQLKELNGMLGCPVREMLRDSEAIYKELGLADASLTDDQLYEAIAANPILLQRPIVVRNGRAVIGRPPENVEALFHDLSE